MTVTDRTSSVRYKVSNCNPVSTGRWSGLTRQPHSRYPSGGPGYLNRANGHDCRYELFLSNKYDFL